MRKLSRKAELSKDNTVLRIVQKRVRFIRKPVTLILAIILILSMPTLSFAGPGCTDPTDPTNPTPNTEFDDVNEDGIADDLQSFTISAIYVNDIGAAITEPTRLTLDAANSFTGTVTAPAIIGYIIASHSIDGGESVTASAVEATFTLVSADHSVVFRYVNDISFAIDDKIGEDPPPDTTPAAVVADGEDPDKNVVDNTGTGNEDTATGAGIGSKSTTGSSTGAGKGSKSTTGSSTGTGKGSKGTTNTNSSTGSSSKSNTGGRIDVGGSVAYVSPDDSDNALPDDKVTEIKPKETPLIPNSGTKILPDLEPPIAAGGVAHWALFNLLLTCTAVAVTAAMLIGWLIRRNEGEENEALKNVCRIISVAASAVALVVFFVTERVSLPMTATDEYTVYSLIIVIVQFALAYLARRTFDEEEIELDI
jgi:hypothetical protein